MTVGISQELKGYQTHLAKIQAEARVISDTINAENLKLKAVNAQIASLNKKIENLQCQASEPIVSEHAMLRWLERVRGINMEYLKQEILGGGTANTIKFRKVWKSC